MNCVRDVRPWHRMKVISRWKAQDLTLSIRGTMGLAVLMAVRVLMTILVQIAVRMVSAHPS